MNPSARTFTPTVELITVCPLLPMTDTVTHAIGLGAVVMAILPLSAALFTPARRGLNEELALPAAMLTVAALVGCAELLLGAWFPEMRQALGIFLPLVTANLILVAELRDRELTLAHELIDSLKVGIGIALTLLLLGIARELVGRGSLLHDAAMLGTPASRLDSQIFPVELGFLLGMLPPGAFIALGLAIAARNWLTQRRS